MELLRQIRERSAISQRDFSKRAGLSYKTYQLVEGGGHDPRLSTLDKISKAAGYPKGAVTKAVEDLFAHAVDSVAVVSRMMAERGETGWNVPLFNFVDAFRRTKNVGLVRDPPMCGPGKARALLASTVENLCAEVGTDVPVWAQAEPALASPWFPSRSENLKVSALKESPLAFRKRNIFVLENFLRRA